MITALQNFFLKHNTWLFGALLIVVIVTFVLTIGNQSFGGSRTYETQRQEFYGYDLSNRQDLATIGQHGYLSLQMDPMKRYTPAFYRTVGNPDDYAFVRVAALGLANQLGIPNPTAAELEDFIRTRSAFLNRQTGEFDEEAYTRFKDTLAANPNVGVNTIAKVLREDFRIERVLDALSGPGYILPYEAEKGYLMQETEWTVRVAKTDYASFEPTIDPTDEDLRAYYDENPGKYTLPERARVDAVLFKGANFIDQVSVPEATALETYFNRNRFKYRAAPNPDSEEAPPEPTLEDVRDQVVADYRLEQAQTIAQSRSEEFLDHLYQNEIALDSEAFAEAVTNFGATVTPVEPYARDNVPTDLGLPAEVFQSAWVFATSDRYFSDLAKTNDGAGLIVVREIIPEQLQAFETVAAAVANDVRAEEKRRLFAAQADEWEQAFAEKLADGTPFSAVAEELGFTVAAPEPFKVRGLPSEINRRTWDATQNLSQGEHSPVVIDENGAAVTYVVEKSTPALDTASELEQTYFDNLSEQRREAGGWFALAEWTSLHLKSLQPEEAPAS